MEDSTNIVTDHEYWGNMCSGFGGKLQCEQIDFVTHQSCGKDPYVHHYFEPKHGKTRLFTNITQTPKGYIGKHMAGFRVCENCDGSGKINDKRCIRCNGKTVIKLVGENSPCGESCWTHGCEGWCV